MPHDIHQFKTDFVCWLFDAGQVDYSGFLDIFHPKKAASKNNAHESNEIQPNL